VCPFVSVCGCVWSGGCPGDCCIWAVCLWGLDVRVGFFLWLVVWVADCGERLWWLCVVFVACVGVVLVGQLK